MREPEEIIEARIVALLASAVPHLDVLGVLSPALEGEQKKSSDTYVSVFVDLASQNLDWCGPNVPCGYSVRVTVYVANADDVSGTKMRDTCRAVRAVLDALKGDRCEALSGDGFSCDSFMLNSTQTDLDQNADGGGMGKTYIAAVTGRITDKER